MFILPDWRILCFLATVSRSPRELEEERRLFYVAVTRAGKMATLSYALNRYKWGNLERSNPSRFFVKLIRNSSITLRQAGNRSGHNQERKSNLIHSGKSLSAILLPAGIKNLLVAKILHLYKPMTRFPRVLRGGYRPA